MKTRKGKSMREAVYGTNDVEAIKNLPPSQPQHTPTPWIYGEANDDGFSNIRDPKSGHLIAQVMGEENAEFIVRAVNSHEELLQLVKDWERMIPVMKDHTPAEDSLRARSLRAITKAEGK